MENKDGKTTGREIKGLSSLVVLILVEVFLIVFVLMLFPGSVMAGIAQNVTVITQLTVGNVAPEILNITLNNFTTSGIDLVANDTKTVTLYAIVRDYNGESDINISYATLFDKAVTYISPDDNNSHYSNSSCFIDYDYGAGVEASYLANITCTFQVWYYANNASWNGTLVVNDTNKYTVRNSNSVTINSLLSIGLPNILDYGTVNSTYVSDEKVANITNFGNMQTNITLEGYAVSRYDNLSMNCSLGAIKNISIFYQKYNLTGSNTNSLTYSQFDSSYVNLTSAPVVKRLNLYYRQNEDTNEAVNASYWRIYVPSGVAGSCSGNIIFGAIRSSGT